MILSTKGIDNSILTSLRTLAKLNNSISDTFKVIHSKFAPGSIGNPNYTKRKEVAQVDRSYSVHPPLDMSVLADSNHAKSFSMGGPLKGVFRQMMKAGTEVIPEFPEIRQPKGTTKGTKIMNPSYQFMNEAEETQLNQTGRDNYDRSDKNVEIGKRFALGAVSKQYSSWLRLAS